MATVEKDNGDTVVLRRVVKSSAITRTNAVTDKNDRKQHLKALESLSGFYGKQSWTAFSSLSPSTITIVGKTNHSLNLDKIFHALDITDVGFKVKKVKKVKIDVLGPPGAVLSARYIDRENNRLVRGIDKGTGFFLNCVCMDLSLKDKNVNFKLFANTVQLTGCKKLAHGIEAAELMVAHLMKIQERGINIFATAPPLVQQAGKTDGLLTGERPSVRLGNEPASGKIASERRKRVVVAEDEGEKKTVHSARSVLSGTESTERKRRVVVREEEKRRPAVHSLEIVMRNNDFYLGFCVNRQELAIHLDGMCGFYASWDSGVANGVTIKLLTEKQEIEYTPRGNVRRRKPKAITFITFFSGSTIQSGKDYGEMERAYNLFRECIAKIRDKIEIKETSG